jgi:(2Fe-2S) ferredoxin/SAM-dependent methyltransferase
MQPFRYHIVVCTQVKPENVRCCAASGGDAIVDALQSELKTQGLADCVIVSTTGCLGGCEHGPIMIVYPDAVWYGAATPADVAEIVRSHLGQGKPVERLKLTDMEALRGEILDHRQKFSAMMQARDTAGVLPDEINEMARAFQISRVVLTAVELDLFTAVGRGAGALEIAAELRTDPRATEMLLNAVAALGLLEKRNGIFSNTPITGRFLVEGSPDNARWALMHTVHLWPRWSTLTECVREGTAVYRRDRNAQLTRAFIAAMDRIAKEAAPAMVRSLPLNGARRMLDLGGGSGAYSIALVKANPGLCAEVLDVPEVVPLAQEYIREARLADRVSTRIGDLRTDHFGQGYDLILLGAICHMFTPEQNRDLFRRAFAALAPKGRLVVRDFILDPDKTSPRFAALFSLNMLVATEGGASYSEPEYEKWLRETGFSDVERVRLPGPGNLMVGTRG